MAILIVDDSRDSRLLLRAYLRAGGYSDVLEAASAEDAGRLLELEDPNAAGPTIDLVLMDIQMPGIDGVEACRRIKSVDRYRDVPVLMVTAQPEAQHLEDSFAAGAWDYIEKPIERSILIARVRSALQLRKEMERRRQREHELLESKRHLEETNRTLQEMAGSDGLTGIANLRRFNQYLEQEWRRSARDQRFISLVLMDIDRFKAYNDTYLHQAGNEALKKVTAALRKQVNRPGDLVARYGGEEIAVILPDTDAIGAVAVAERLRQAVEALRIPHEGSDVVPWLTITGGAASVVPMHDLSTEMLVAQADRALYRAKQSGRNRVCLAEWAVPLQHCIK